MELSTCASWTAWRRTESTKRVGNNDSHAKNLSLCAVPDQGVLLTPFYDLMCTRLYPGLSQEFAFSIGGEFKAGSMTRQHLEALAGQLGMRPQFFLRQAAELAEKVPAALHRALQETRPALSRSARALASKLAHFVESTIRKTAARFSRRAGSGLPAATGLHRAT
jgi:serine/threonine-protein kinase HipA